MGVEIERRFLVIDEGWRSDVRTTRLVRQGYLALDVSAQVRVRVIGREGFLTVKGPATGLVRREFEYAIPLADAEAMLAKLCGSRVLVKRRSTVVVDGVFWDVDEYEGELAGLVVAEVELADPDQSVDPPYWVGREITGDAAYGNSSLASRGRPPADQ